MAFLTNQEHAALGNGVLTFTDDGKPFSRDSKYVSDEDKGRDYLTIRRIYNLSNNPARSKTSQCAFCDSNKTTLYGFHVQKTSEEYVIFSVQCCECGKCDEITVKWTSLHYYLMLY